MNRNFGPNNNDGDDGRLNANRGGRGNNRRLGRGGRRGGGRGRGNNRRGDPNENNRNNTPPTPRLSIPEIRQSQQETTIANFSSSELSYKGSDKIIFITNGDPIKDIWKRVLKKEPWNQNDVRFFVSSALVATDSKTGYRVEEIVKELGNPAGGLKKLREIINFSSMSCDAGLRNDVLSFQYVILPLLGLLTRTTITDCNLEKYVNAIFTTVYTNLVSIFKRI
jgi:hypothetical protein